MAHEEDIRVYDLESKKMPYLYGTGLQLFVKALGWPVIGKLLIANLLQTAGIEDFRNKKIDAPPKLKPIHFSANPAATYTQPELEPVADKDRPQGQFHYRTTLDYHHAYLEGTATPEAVADKVFVAIEDSNQREPPLRAVIFSDAEDIRKQAAESAARYQSGNPLSPLDGVPVAVKDEVDQVPYPTTAGTAFLGAQPCGHDATIVTRLREMGALLIGKTNMHEIGINVTGLNPHHGLVRNPYSLEHYSGGSSSGSGSSVAAGLCPVAIGADGGGSIRIPAAFCGVVGLKSTFGRISEHGATPLCWSVAHLGPLAATTQDAALAWLTIAGPDLQDPDSLHQPAPELDAWDQLDPGKVRIGVFWPWLQHADEEIVAACEKMLGQYEQMGAQIVDIKIPSLEAGRVAHLITIASEMAQAMSDYHEDHGHEHGLDIKINLILARSLSSEDYIRAQRMRSELTASFMKAFEQVDMVATPTTGLTAPVIKPRALPNGDSDLTVLMDVMRFAQPPNLTGLPAISFPVGYNHEGLPIGLQLIGKPWDEKTLLGMSLRAEEVVERRKPGWHYSLLD